VRTPELCNDLRIELFGTMMGWKPGDRRHLAEIATSAGVGDLVFEEPGRVSYRRSLELLLQGDGGLILGVDDPGYMPSKLFSYAFSSKPIISILHRDGPAFAHLQRFPELGHRLWFGATDEITLQEAAEALEPYLREVRASRILDRTTALQPFV